MFGGGDEEVAVSVVGPAVDLDVPTSSYRSTSGWASSRCAWDTFLFSVRFPVAAGQVIVMV
ncbi:hypothetical protein [Amycolatopsis sp. NPDC003676]